MGATLRTVEKDSGKKTLPNRRKGGKAVAHSRASGFSNVASIAILAAMYCTGRRAGARRQLSGWVCWIHLSAKAWAAGMSAEKGGSNTPTVIGTVLGAVHGGAHGGKVLSCSPAFHLTPSPLFSAGSFTVCPAAARPRVEPGAQRCNSLFGMHWHWHWHCLRCGGSSRSTAGRRHCPYRSTT